jgi:hypothetical protein
MAEATQKRRGGAKAKDSEVAGKVADQDQGVQAPETPEVKEPEAKKEAKGEVVFETEKQLSIHREQFYSVQNKGAKVVVKNIGYGDAYVGTESPAIKPENLIVTGEEKVFEDVGLLFLDSASQPKLVIQEVK